MLNNLSNFCSSYSLLMFYFLFQVLFLLKGNVLKIACVPLSPFHNIVKRVQVCPCSYLLLLSSETEIDPQPLSNCKEYLPICHWNLNSISDHDYSELFLLKAYVILHEFDIICLSGTYYHRWQQISNSCVQFDSF